MKLPLAPPKLEPLLAEMVRSHPQRLVELLSRPMRPDPNGRYDHWDKLRHLTPPDGLTHAEWWFGIKQARRAMDKPLPFTDVRGEVFRHAQPDVVQRLLHQVAQEASGHACTPEAVSDPAIKAGYRVNSLIEEAITSSQLEGAATTRRVAKEMLRLDRKPADKSERMIVNNYRAMQFIDEMQQEPLTPGMVLELHRILTHGTLDHPDQAGRLRAVDDISVADERDATTLHIPPKAAELEERLIRLCRFANEPASNEFIHPVIKAIVLHFVLAYDHPFVDGNGRTARALFYWSMLHQGYWLAEFLSISRILKAAPARYARAFLYTETDDNDLTYFIVHQLEVIVRAIADLHLYLERKAAEMGTVEALFKQSSHLGGLLNHRQIALLNRALKTPQASFTVEGHRRSHNVVTQTARSDLLKLEALGLLEKRKIGKGFTFTVPNDLRQRIEGFGAA